MRPALPLLWMIAALGVIGVVDLLQRLFGGGEAAWAFDVWRVGLTLLILLSLCDLLLSRKKPLLTVQRQVPNSWSQGQWLSVRLEFVLDGARVEAIEAFDLVPKGMHARGLPAQLTLLPRQPLLYEYQVQANARGEFTFSGVDLRRVSRLRLWQLQWRASVQTTVRVYPDFSWLNRYLLLVGEQRMRQSGMRMSPRRGEGLEFHQLREFRDGDSPRQVDWKASARRDKLISREYQEERDQQILMVLDTGRRMRASDGEVSHFDEVLRAMLLLSCVALRQGDSVGLLTFGRGHRWLPMQRGTEALSKLLHTVYDLDADTSASDYLQAAKEIRVRQRRRALIVLLTNAREEDEDLLSALHLLGEHHIVLVTSLRESAVDAIEQAPVLTLSDALLSSAAAAHHLERQRVQEVVARAGHRLLDSTPAQLPMQLVNDYWRVKRSGKL